MNNTFKLLLIINCIFLYTATSQVPEDLVFHKTEETLARIKEIISHKQKGMYLRFGDGELAIALGYGNNEQAPHSQLTAEMQEALALNGSTLLKTVPLYSREFGGWEAGMFLPSNHEMTYEGCLQMLAIAQKFWNAPITDAYSHIALHFASTTYPDKCYDFLKFLKSSNCCLLVGNQEIPKHLRDLLFGEKCVFVPTSPTNSYDQIDRIERECLEKIGNNNEYKVIITCMGAPGKVLQKRLWPQLENIFIFDFGSLMDAICGWNTRWWIAGTNFNSVLFIEQFKNVLNQ